MAQERPGLAASSSPALQPSSGRHLGLLLLSVALMACGQQASSPPSTSDPVQLEAENGTVSPLASQDIAEPRTGGKVIRDQNASGGQAVILLSNNDAVKFKLPANFASGRYTVKVVGRGEEYRGWPTVALENDRRGRMSVTTVDTRTYGVRGFGQFDLRPNQEMYVSFTNDLYDGPGKDRNVVVDYLLIEPVKTPPAVNQPPTVTLRPIQSGVLTPPIPGDPASDPDTFVDDNNIILRADASDPDGKIAKVEFYYGLSKIGEDTTAPYTFADARDTDIDTTFQGNYTARAVDDRGATVTSAERFAVFYSGNSTITASPAIHFGGPDVQIESYEGLFRGLNFSAGDRAGVTTNGTPTVLPAGTPLSPTPRPDREALMRTALSRQGGLEVNVPVPNASYQVYLWVRAEDATPYDIRMEGQTVGRFEPGAAGQWKRLGALSVTVKDGVLNIASTGSATASFSAIEVYSRQPVPSQPSAYFPSDLPRYARAGQPLTLRVVATTAVDTISKLEFYALNVGTTQSFKLGELTSEPEVTSAPYTFVWQDTPTSGTYNVGVIATDNSGRTSAIGRSSDVTFTTDESLLR